MWKLLVTLSALLLFTTCSAFGPARPKTSVRNGGLARVADSSSISLIQGLARPGGKQLQMSLFDDAFRFFSNMNKEASAKHILIKGSGAEAKLAALKADLEKAPDLSAAFSEVAAKVSECPSAARGGNLGTFKPGMMVREFDRVCFEEEVGKVHGPVTTQFGSHLILITRRYEGEKK